MAIQYPFIASNRNFNIPMVDDDYQSVTADGSLTYLNCTPPYEQHNSLFYDMWLKILMGEIITSGRVMIFIHGFYNKWSKVIDTSDTGLAGMLTHFSNAPLWLSKAYPGPIILFDWPSYFVYDKSHPCYFFNAARSNATVTAKRSFGQLKKIVDDIQKIKAQTKIDVVCHSMGNFVLQQSVLPGAVPFTAGSINTFLINAAAIANDSFVPGSAKTPANDIIMCLSQQGSAHVLWSSNDDALPEGQVCDMYKELGLSGPSAGSVNIKNHDFSSIVIKPAQGGAPSIHTSYYYIKASLDQMVSMMTT